jgi:hypothetical protein
VLYDFWTLNGQVDEINLADALYEAHINGAHFA